MPEYETIEGTDPVQTRSHEPRTIKRTNQDGSVYMMTEIEDGVFVQWGTCTKCSERVDACTCTSGPQMPGYVQTWRDRRFENSLKNRPKVADLLPPAEVRSLIEAVHDTQRAAAGDSNDREIEVLNDALEAALGLLGVTVPDLEDEEDEDDGLDPDNLTGMDLGDGEPQEKPERAEEWGWPEPPEADQPASSDTRQDVDSGMDAALERLRATKESEDVGF